MHPSADPLELLDHEPPTRRCLQRHLELPAAKRREERSHPATVCRRDPAPGDLTGLGIEPLDSDLRSMLVTSHYDRHLGASSRSTV